MQRIWNIVNLFFLSYFACNSPDATNVDTVISPYPAMTLQETPRDILNYATQFVRQVAGTSLAQSWSAAAALEDEVRPLNRPDIEDVAYYEFAVDEGGYLVVSSGSHDVQIPHWSDSGTRPTDSLIDGPDAVGAFYKLDQSAYVAEGADGRLAKILGRLPPKPELLNAEDGEIVSVEASQVEGYEANEAIVISRETAAGREVLSESSDAERIKELDGNLQSWGSWEDLKAEYARSYRLQLSRLSLQAQEEMNDRSLEDAEMSADVPNGEPNLPVTRSYWVVNSNSIRYNLKYRQESYPGCAMGCGPTAWTMYLGYGAINYSCSSGLWPDGTPPTASYNLEVQSVENQLRSTLNTFCIAGSGATYPSDMTLFQSYLANKVPYYKMNVEYSSVGIQYDSIRDLAIQMIKESGLPVVLGTGWLGHYPVALGYGEIGSSKYFYVNQGWGGEGDGWISAATFFAGGFKSSCAAPTPPPCPTNYKCCEWDKYPTTCALCRPKSQYCP